MFDSSTILYERPSCSKQSSPMAWLPFFFIKSVTSTYLTMELLSRPSITSAFHHLLDPPSPRLLTVLPQPPSPGPASILTTLGRPSSGPWASSTNVGGRRDQQPYQHRSAILNSLMQRHPRRASLNTDIRTYAQKNFHHTSLALPTAARTCSYHLLHIVSRSPPP